MLRLNIEYQVQIVPFVTICYNVLLLICSRQTLYDSPMVYGAQKYSNFSVKTTSQRNQSLQSSSCFPLTQKVVKVLIVFHLVMRRQSRDVFLLVAFNGGRLHTERMGRAFFKLLAAAA